MRACFGVSKNVSETFLILCIFERVFMNIFRYSVEEPLFLSDFDETNLLDSFSKNSRTWNFMKIRLVGTELFVRTDRYTNGRTDRQTDRQDITKLIVVFRSFANAPENCYEILPITTLTWVLLKPTVSRPVNRLWDPTVHVTAFGSSSYWHLCTLTYVQCSLSHSLTVFVTTTPLCAMCSTLWSLI
jgi:hypothetical protein